MTHSTLINGRRLRGKLKKMRRQLEEREDLRENRLFESQLQELTKTAAGQFFPLEDGMPPLGAKVAALSEISDESVCELIQKEKLTRYISEEELSSLMWSSRFCLISFALRDKGEEWEKYTGKMYALLDVDLERLEELSRMDGAFRQDEIYCRSTRETRRMYRAHAAAISRAAGIEQEKYTRELVSRSTKSGEHLGKVIETDYRRVFPYISFGKYFWWLMIISALLSVGVGLLTNLWLSLLVFFPAVGAVKPLADMAAARRARSDRLAKIEISEEIPAEGKTACVLSALVSDENSLEQALKNLFTAKLKNPQKGIVFALLCDLPAAKEEEIPADDQLFSAADRLKEEIFPQSIIIFRKRKYSPTMEMWQGFDRKRGAVEELLVFMDGKKGDFRYISGNAEELKSCVFLTALDFDTVPLMDSVRELISAALHPLNGEYGIIAPRCGSDLSSTLKTPFARIMAGNGGVSGISAYDSFCGEFYFDCFGEGIFCGKGLIKKDAFLKSCKGAFPAERVLSHDILEGGLCNVAFDGEAEFSDSFPASSRSFFKRSHRWLRGDFQNLRFIFKKGFSPLTRFKLLDNFRRGINPPLIMAMFFLSCFVDNGSALAAGAYLAALLPFLPPLAAAVQRGFAFGVTRRFYSPIISETSQILLRALAEIMTLPKAALVSLDALWKTVWRNLVTKKNLLQWTTSGLLERSAFKGGVWGLLSGFLLSLLLLGCCIYGESCSVVAALIMCGGFPALVYWDKPSNSGRRGLKKEQRAELLCETEKMFSFYTAYTTAETGFLPPDNVQYYPVYRVCPRTSPTNIGMYLLSAACVCGLGIISEEEFIQRVGQTLDTVERLKKWRGNLYNWYDVRELAPVSSFVSTVDSGNFVCCLIAVKEMLKRVKGGELLAARCERIAEQTDLAAFYCKKRKLFSIGFDESTQKLSPHRYDMLMSEARLTSYYAIATGQAPKEHWRALSRTMSRSGRYAGAVAWTGTMFEFYMPELLLTSKEGSMSYEALKFAFHCQKRRGEPFGISESGYYAFDGELNFQYKAHGVQTTALKDGMDRERVVSPYSSFLTLSREPYESWNNLAKLKKEGAYDPEFGFYEAVDYTPQRVGTKAIVKSHMAHHVGMSIAGAANALADNICSRLFLSDDKMRRAEELLEERVMAGEKVLKTLKRKSGELKPPALREEITRHSLKNSPVNILGGGKLSVYNSANGRTYCCFDGKTAFGGRENGGCFFGYCTEKKIYPFLYTGDGSGELKTVFSSEESEYSLRDKELSLSMTVSADIKNNGEIRRFKAVNRGKSKKLLTLCAYCQPVFAAERDYRAHPVFMDMFMNVRYDREKDLFLLWRNDRNGGRSFACAVGFMKREDMTYCLSREKCTDSRPFSFFQNALIRENVDSSLPYPCLFIKAAISLDAGESSEQTLFFRYGDTVEQAIKGAEKLRKEGISESEPFAPPPLSLSTLHGSMAAKALPALLYGETEQEEIIKARGKNTLSRHGLWKYGISGDIPLLVFVYDSDTAACGVRMKGGLEQGGINCDLVALCADGLQKKAAEQQMNGCGHALITAELSEAELTLVYALAARVIKIGEPPARKKEPPVLPILPSFHKEEEDRFTEEGYVVSSSAPIRCNVMANKDFGTLVSQNSLGFTWAKNSRENKLTPWNNDPIRDNRGELLLIERGGRFFDLIRGSRAFFSPSECRWEGLAAGLSCHVREQVYTEGMGKVIDLTLENGGDKAAEFRLCYRIQPVLGGDSGACSAVCFGENNAVTVVNPLDPYFHGGMAVCCSKTAKFLTKESAFDAGDFSYAKERLDRTYCEIVSLIVPLKLPPKSKERIRFILGYCDDPAKAAEYVRGLEGKPCGYVLKNRFLLSSPDEGLNRLFNIWLPHQALVCRLWARTGFFQNGGAYGFRDQLQDCLAIMYFDPDIAKEHIYRCCESQFPEGDVLHWWHILGDVKAGIRTRYSDDLLWLPYVACDWQEKVGEEGFWEREFPYCTAPVLEEGQEESFTQTGLSDFKESLYSHCKRAMEKGFSKGENGLLKIGGGDWNDGYNNVGAKGKGESVWLSMFYIMCGKKFAAAAREMRDDEYADKLEKRVSQLTVSVEESCWDGDRYIRAFYDNGEKMGAAECDACRIDLLPQAFSVLCGLPDASRCETALNTAYNKLLDEENGIIKLFSPPFSPEKSKQKPGYVMYYPEGLRENGGQYTHAAVWYCLACFKMGQRERGVRLLKMLDPTKKPPAFGREPYFITADIYTNPHCYGRGGWSMYTGAAAWYWKCIFEGLLGGEMKKGKVKFAGALPEGTEITVES